VVEPSLIVIGALVAAYLGLLRRFKPPRERSFRAFASAAELLAGKYIPSTYMPRLEARVQHVELLARLHGSPGATQPPRGLETEVTAAAPGAPLMLLLPRGAATTLGAALGGQDVLTGAAAFDAGFMVKAADAGHVRAWLTAPVRQALLETSDYSYELVEGRLVASRLSWETDAQRLCAVMVACAMLARAGIVLYAKWVEIAAVLGASLPAGQVWPAGGLVFDFLVLGTPLRVECTRRPPERDVWQTRVLGPATGRELPAELRAELEAIEGEAGLEGAGVFVRWAGIEPERARLERAVALMAAWSGARAAAAYR
jgi:hypothetical protein